jgi:uncharacterized protein (TIRG00374 family)
VKGLNWGKAGVAALLIVLLLSLVDLGELWSALGQLTWGMVLLLALLSVLLIYISALKWQYFVEALGSKVGAGRLFSLYVLGYFINQFAPSVIGGDVVRSLYIGREVGQHKALSATILERFTGLVAMVSLALVFVWFVDGVTVEIQVLVVFIALGLLGASLLALSDRPATWLARITYLKGLSRHLEKVQACFQLARQERSLLLKAMLLSYLFHSFTVLNTMAAAAAVGWMDPNPGDLFVVLPLIMLISMLPISPSGLGVQEGAIYFFLQGIGASPAQALGVGLILRAKSVILGLIGGVIWMSWPDLDKRRS